MQFSKSQKLFIVLVGIFLTNALTSEIIGSKLFSLEETLGLPSANLTLFGISNLSFTLTAGVIAWPVVFTVTDIINDYYGVRAVRFMSYIGVGMISFMFLLLVLAIHVHPNSYWLTSNQNKGVENMQTAYALVLGQGLSIIFASVIAFFIGQILDAMIFRTIKKITGDKHIWLRALISTLFSQLIDTVVVLYIAFFIIQKVPFAMVSAWVVTVYIYKFFAALLFLPLVYLMHLVVEKYLGKSEAIKMRAEALN